MARKSRQDLQTRIERELASMPDQVLAWLIEFAHREAAERELALCRTCHGVAFWPTASGVCEHCRAEAMPRVM